VIILLLLATGGYLLFANRHYLAFVAGLDSNRHRIEGDNPTITEDWIPGSGSSPEVQQAAVRQPLHTRTAPGLFPSQRQDPIQPVVAPGYPREDLLARSPFAHGEMASKPT
jgi:hypothetical protein